MLAKIFVMATKEQSSASHESKRVRISVGTGVRAKAIRDRLNSVQRERGLRSLGDTVDFLLQQWTRLCELRQLADAACQTGFDNESIAVDASLNVHVEDNPALEEYLAIDIETEVNPTLQDANVQTGSVAATLEVSNVSSFDPDELSPITSPCEVFDEMLPQPSYSSTSHRRHPLRQRRDNVDLDVSLLSESHAEIVTCVNNLCCPDVCDNISDEEEIMIQTTVNEMYDGVGNQESTPMFSSLVDPYTNLKYGNLEEELSAIKETRCFASAEKLKELLGSSC